MRTQRTVGLDLALEVLVAPVRNWSTLTSCNQPVNHTSCPDPVGLKWRSICNILFTGIAHGLGKAQPIGTSAGSANAMAG